MTNTETDQQIKSTQTISVLPHEEYDHTRLDKTCVTTTIRKNITSNVTNDVYRIVNESLTRGSIFIGQFQQQWQPLGQHQDFVAPERSS